MNEEIIKEAVLETRHCTLCGPEAEKQVRYPATFSDDDLSARVFSARRAPDRRHFRLVECSSCGIVYSDPACPPDRLATLYKEAAVTYGAQEEQIYDSYTRVLDRALPWVGNRGTFLEIGGGSGFMLRYGVKHGFKHQIEIEPSADAEKRFAPASSNARFIRGIFTKGALPANSVSFACFFQMLDHVPNPGEFLANVYEALEPGGVAVCVTHNTKSFSARALGERSPIYDIEHTYLFNMANLPKLFEKVGFDKTESFPISNRYAFRHWLHLAPIPPGLKKVAAKGFEVTKIGNLRFPIRAGNFGVIARKKK